MKAVMYGAGNIGRGFIGQLFAESGYSVTFIDVDDALVGALNREGRYPVRILSGESSRDVWIEGVSAINGKNGEEVSSAIASADIMATAVGVRVLPFIAPLIAFGIRKRLAAGGGPLNVIICENLIDADKVLAKLIAEHLNAEERNYFETSVGLVEASIGRMVPLQTEEMRDGNPLRICVEAYGFLPVDKAAFKGVVPPVAGMRPFDNFGLYIERKLFVHNMGHAVCAYFGMICGDTYIYETVRRSGILHIAGNAMTESALALSSKYGCPLSDLHYHIRDLLLRFSNRALGDTCARVGADTARKLGNRDRLIGALLCCSGEGVVPAFISAGAAAALYCHLRESGVPQSGEAALAVLKEVSGLGLNSAEAERILSFYLILARFKGNDFEKTIEEIIAAASASSSKPGII